MFNRNAAVIDIGSKYTKIMLGSRNFGKVTVKKFDVLKTPEGSIEAGFIKDTELLGEEIKKCFSDQKIKPLEVSFSIHGQDIVARHMDVPIMDEKSVEKASEWEIKQYLPDNGEQYYIHYQILDTINESDKKMYKTLVVAVPKDKIDRYVELSQRLELKLKAIDISANSIARIFREPGQTNKIYENIGVIDMGNKSSNLIVLEKGNLFIEREVPFGVENLIREISRKLQIEVNEAKDYLFGKFDFDNMDVDSEVEMRIQTLMDNVFSSFQKVIQFYLTGRTKKNLDKIYIAGGGSKIQGLCSYINTYFSSPAHILESPEELSIKSKLPGGCDFRFYLNTFGLLLRKE